MRKSNLLASAAERIAAKNELAALLEKARGAGRHDLVERFAFAMFSPGIKRVNAAIRVIKKEIGGFPEP